VLDFLDIHSGSIVGAATLVLACITAYYAWTTRALVRETHTTLQAAARATLQARMDRISELCIQDPTLFARLNDPSSTGDEEDARFFLSNMFLGVLEEAFVQYSIERSMSADDWAAWAATAETFLSRLYVARYWTRVARTFEPGFGRFVDERIRAARAD